MIISLLLILCYRFPKLGFGNLDKESIDGYTGIFSFALIIEFMCEACVLITLL